MAKRVWSKIRTAKLMANTERTIAWEDDGSNVVPTGNRNHSCLRLGIEFPRHGSWVRLEFGKLVDRSVGRK